MKITNNGISQTSLTPLQQTADSMSVSRDASATTTAESDSYTPSAEWTRLLELARQEPEIREGRVAEVVARLQSGVYLDAAAAEKTADAILSSLD